MKRFAKLTLAAAIAAPAAAAFADDTPPALPGVDTTYRIVSPEPEPDEFLPAGESPLSFRIGNVDVTVGGELRHQIGISTATDPATGVLPRP